jgi:hypothetical protein
MRAVTWTRAAAAVRQRGDMPRRMPLPFAGKSSVNTNRHAHSGQHRLELDALFERTLVEFRRVVDQMLVSEPAGPAQTLRAFVRAACACGIHLPQDQKDKLGLLLQTPLYQEIWIEYFDEACACDLVEENTIVTCRLAIDGLWHDSILYGKGGPKHFLRTRNYLLSLTNSGNTVSPFIHHAPHRTR